MKAVPKAQSIDAEVEAYLKLPYRRMLVPSKNGSWFAGVPELPGCVTSADDATKAFAQLDEAMSLWIQFRLERGQPIPPPAGDTQFSGRFLVRSTGLLHRALVERAEAEGVSLNQLAVTMLSYELGLGADVVSRPHVSAPSGKRNGIASVRSRRKKRTRQDTCRARQLTAPYVNGSSYARAPKYDGSVQGYFEDSVEYEQLRSAVSEPRRRALGHDFQRRLASAPRYA
jgi:predicted RNase H-like HicB family nuclease